MCYEILNEIIQNQNIIKRLKIKQLNIICFQKIYFGFIIYFINVKKTTNNIVITASRKVYRI